jgi:hypothetical protein
VSLLDGVASPLDGALLHPNSKEMTATIEASTLIGTSVRETSGIRRLTT